jgi:hypothetical protein
MDGERQIMISEALNESDRLSSCNKRVRKVMESQAGPFHVYVFEPRDEASPSGPSPNPNVNPEDLLMCFNLGGIRMNQAAFKKLEQEISLVPVPMSAALAHAVTTPDSTAAQKSECRLLSGMVPVDREIFRAIVLRESRIPRIHSEDFSVLGWSDRSYYEVCTDPAIYAALEKDKDKEKRKAAKT